MAEAGTTQADVAAEAQDGDLLPLAHDFDREEEVETDQGSNDGWGWIVNQLGDCETNDEADCEQQAGDAADIVDPDSSHLAP